MRAPTTADIPALHQLMAEILAADREPYAVPIEEVEELFDHPDIDPADDLRVVEDASGDLIGWAEVVHSPSGERLERARLAGGVHPEHRRRGIGRELLAWQTRRATELVADVSPHLSAVAMLGAYEWQEANLRLVERAGYRPSRWFDELHRSLDDLPSLLAPPGITIRSWGPDDSEPARLVGNAAFADHWGSTPRTSETWSADLSAHGRRLDLSFVAEESGEVVGYSLNAYYPDDVAVTGRHDGWIDSLGTLRSHRRRGIASALVVASLHAFAGAGLEGAMLGVDSDNPSGAYGIYERLGFRRQHRNIVFVTTLREATPGPPAEDPPVR